MTSCADCLAWGLTYARGMCMACDNFASRQYRHLVGDCGACRRWVPLKNGYCRLCWCQAKLDRALVTDHLNEPLAPYLPHVRYHQLFLADLYNRRARPPVPAMPRLTGRAHTPLVAHDPRGDGAQLALFTDLPRTYRPRSIDLRSVAVPDNPWLAWGLHLAHVLGETRGFGPSVRSRINRHLVTLLATHHDGDTVRVSEFAHVLHRHGGGVNHVIDILSAMGVLVDDRPNVFDTWLAAKREGLAPAIADHLDGWARVLRDGGPRRHPRQHGTIVGYVLAVRPALLSWSERYDHLREVTRADVLAYLDTLRGTTREHTLGALRSLFGWAKSEAAIFANPCARMKMPKAPSRIWQPLTGAEIAATIEAADTPQAKVCLVLAAVHAARYGHIRALQLDDVDLGNRQIVLAGRLRHLDELTYRVLAGWLDHRQRRWPHTANPHLLLSPESALRHGPVSAPYILNLRGLPANLERLRIDRQLEEALACGGDPLHLAAVFDIDTSTAIRYATNARRLLHDTHAAVSPGCSPTQVPVPEDEAGPHSGSARKPLGSNELP
ncbi:hypothetical protein ACQP1G_42280 [Nocardia sp. CA-107356]|uniref:hypothetical protein n=1 Tax=Nocardia sp. CA-107356 TaxID=3239972 RepID=UPI003D94AFF0